MTMAMTRQDRHWPFRMFLLSITTMLWDASIVRIPMTAEAFQSPFPMTSPRRIQQSIHYKGHDRPPNSLSTTTSTTTTTTQLCCELLGMNCAQPTDFSFSFQGFCKRGGETDIHADGWGICFEQNHGLRQFHDDQPASQSQLANFLVTYPIRTKNMMAHIRYATHGNVDLANVHPFVREWAGVQWSFAHNGHVPLFIDSPQVRHHNQLPTLGDKHHNQTQVYHPVGTTDSEAAFCALLNALRAKYQTTLPSLPELYKTLQKLCHEIVQYDPPGTILNFLLTCGPHVLWVYSWPGRRPNSKVWNGLHYTVREPPFTKCHLRDLDYTVDFSLLTNEQDRVAVVATRPLTDDEEWIELRPGELVVLDEGVPHVSPQELVRLEVKGHGLNATMAHPSIISLNTEDAIAAATATVKKTPSRLKTIVNSTEPTLQQDYRRYAFKQGFHMGGGGI